MNYSIIPSLIAHDQEELMQRFTHVKGLTDTFQLDIMDGRFVKDTTFAFPFALPKKSSFEAHLMVTDPFDWIKKNSQFVDSVIVHAETLPFSLFGKPFLAIIKQLHGQKKSVGLALNPGTPVKKIRPYLETVDSVLLMTVHPGAYGSRFLPEILPKIEEVRRLAPRVTIEVDGGITPETLKQCRKAGANSFVVGSYLQNASSVKEAWTALQRAL